MNESVIGGFGGEGKSVCALLKKYDIGLYILMALISKLDERIDNANIADMQLFFNLPH